MFWLSLFIYLLIPTKNYPHPITHNWLSGMQDLSVSAGKKYPNSSQSLAMLCSIRYASSMFSPLWVPQCPLNEYRIFTVFLTVCMSMKMWMHECVMIRAASPAPHPLCSSLLLEGSQGNPALSGTPAADGLLAALHRRRPENLERVCGYFNLLFRL